MGDYRTQPAIWHNMFLYAIDSRKALQGSNLERLSGTL